jgi:hypothetical protein
MKPELFKERSTAHMYTCIRERSHVKIPQFTSVVANQKARSDNIRFLSLPDVTPIDHLIEQDRTILSAVEAQDAD